MIERAQSQSAGCLASNALHSGICQREIFKSLSDACTPHADQVVLCLSTNLTAVSFQVESFGSSGLRV